MIAQILKKDWKLLWPLAVLVTLIQVGVEWADFNLSLANANPAGVELMRPLTVAWFLGIAALAVAVVQQDAIPGVEQDWLIRPIKRTHLLLAKMAFLLATLTLPMFVLNLAHAWAIGFPLQRVVGVILYKEVYTFALLFLPLLALGAATRTLSELTLLGAGLVVVYAVSSVAGAFLLGPDRCPTCGSGLTWQEHLLQHLELAAGAGVILGLQYYGRRTTLARVLLLAGAAVLVFVQIPWPAAFAIQQRVSGTQGASAAVVLELAGSFEVEAGGSAAAPRPPAGRQATRALLHGDVDRAVDYLRRRAPGDSFGVDVPLSIAGVAADELLLVDRAEARVLGDAGRILYRGAIADESPSLLSPDATESPGVDAGVHQSLRLPGWLLTSASARTPKLQIDYSLTLMKVIEEHRMAAVGGELRSPVTGLCRSQFEEDSVTLRCRQIGPSPFCFRATLYGPDGAHNPAIRKCVADYRPYIPAFTFVLNYFGMELPVRDRTGATHYAVDDSQLSHSFIVFEVYGQRDHFTRTIPPIALHD